MQLGTMSNMFGALKSGAVEASVVSPPTQFLSEKMGFKEIVNITEMDLAYPNPSMAVSGDLIRKKPDLIDRFMRAYVRAMHRARNRSRIHDQDPGKIHDDHRYGDSEQDL